VNFEAAVNNATEVIGLMEKDVSKAMQEERERLTIEVIKQARIKDLIFSMSCILEELSQILDKK